MCMFGLRRRYSRRSSRREQALRLRATVWSRGDLRSCRAAERHRRGIAHRDTVLFERDLDQPVESSSDDELLAGYSAYPQDRSLRGFVEAIDALIVEWIEDPRSSLRVRVPLIGYLSQNLDKPAGT